MMPDASALPAVDAGPSQARARFAGLLYFGTIAAGIFAQLFARSAVSVPGDARATAANILAHETLYRAGELADLVMLACYVAVTMLFYDMFRRAHRLLSQLAAGFSLTGIAVLAVNGLFHLAPLVLLGDDGYRTALGADRRDALVRLSLDLHGDGYGISLVFFGVYCVLLGWLLIRSGLLPRIIGLLMILGGLCHLIVNGVAILSPALAAHLPGAMAYPPLIGEAALALWLLAFGVARR